MTDIILTNFVSSTGVDPAVAQDILDSHEWDLEAALKSFSDLKSSKVTGKEALSGHFKMPVTGEVARNVGKPLLQKNDAVEVAADESTGRKWSRGISTASENLALVTRARSDVARGFTSDDPSCVPNHTFTLPDLTAIQPDEFRAFVENDLIETATLVSLEQAGRLNWWADTKPCQRLLPLATTGDGNCLLHAASLGIWGFHDRLLTLRKSLNHVLSKSEHEASIYRRWRWHQTILNKQSGLIYTESEWEKEWFGILKLSSAEPRIKPAPYICCDNSPNRNLAIVEETEDLGGDEYNTQYESLEEVHVFALAYAIKRPIIVIADVYLRDSCGEPLAPIPFGGIYLPLGCDPKHCLRSPLILTYDAAHFSALVPIKKDSPEGSELSAVIPVTDNHGDLLPVLFLVDPGESFQWGREDADPQVVEKLTSASPEEKLHVVQMYLDLVKVTVSVKGKDSISGASGGVDDRRSTADSNESESSSGSRIEKQKSGFSKQIKSVRQKLKRSISKLTRRTSEESDVTVAMRSPSSAAGTLEKNLLLQQNAARNMPPVHFSEVNLRVTGNGQTHVVYENSGYRWTVEEVRDVHGTELLRNPNIVLGSPLSLDHETSFHEEMISNYLTAARVRFDNHLKDKERRDNLHLRNGKTRCASPGCDLLGTAATNYLCAGCFAKQKVQLEEMKAQRETTTIGKSTFYATARDGEDVVPNNQRSLTPRGTLPALQKPNSVVEEGKNSVSDGAAEDVVVKPCRTADCIFFGQEKSDFLCSQCFKQKNHTCLLPSVVASADLTNR